ncbi:MAG: hypothetical protein H6732_03275 [Alphaproteobacteria bacterium]|nr:hypothetical protein [Alphaproteobacteria bacterium]
MSFLASLSDAAPGSLSWALLVCLGLLAVALWGWWLASTRVARGNARRAGLARQAETEAERLLAARGFRVVDRQVTRTFDIDVDGAPVEVWCRADLVVSRRRRQYVAEVKSGHAGSDPTHPATRRQLLEYRLAFDVDGVLLVDMRRRAVVEVGFPLLPRWRH